ncbi:MAG: hypothetical protein ACEPOV_13950 [Hyphomicrobiales bacterium]
MDKKELDKLISWRSLSMMLAGNDSSIRTNYVSKKYQSKVTQLKLAIQSVFDERNDRERILAEEICRTRTEIRKLKKVIRSLHEDLSEIDKEY